MSSSLNSTIKTLSNPISEHVLRNLFDRYDKDRDGTLNMLELHAILSHLGSNLRVEDLDLDGDNRVSFEELKVLSDTIGRHTHPIFKAALDHLTPSSHNETTTIAVSGYAQENPVFLRMAAKSWRTLSSLTNFDERSIADAFRKIDVDNDGYLTPTEIRRVMLAGLPTARDPMLYPNRYPTGDAGRPAHCARPYAMPSRAHPPLLAGGQGDGAEDERGRHHSNAVDGRQG